MVVAALAGAAGIAEQVAPYDLRVDRGGDADERLPPGTAALVETTRPTVGDVAAYETVGDDLAAGEVHSIRETDSSRHYTIQGGSDDPTIVNDDEVFGQLVAHAAYVGTPWTLPVSVQMGINALLVGAYMAAGTFRNRSDRSDGIGGLFRRVFRR